MHHVCWSRPQIVQRGKMVIADFAEVVRPCCKQTFPWVARQTQLQTLLKVIDAVVRKALIDVVCDDAI